jgi:hypothetical protein
VLSGTGDPLEGAILATLPTGPGQRHGCVFVLVRRLKALPHLAEAGPENLKAIVHRWHQLALPFIRTRSFVETWRDFVDGWGLVKYPHGSGPVEALLARALAEPLPTAALAYERDGVRHLVALCHQLQQRAGSDPFFLGCRTAGKVLGVSHVTAWSWLRVLQDDGILERTLKGSKKSGKASEWRLAGTELGERGVTNDAVAGWGENGSLSRFTCGS